MRSPQFAKFLETAGLYRRFPFSAVGVFMLKQIPQPGIQAYCNQCAAERTFQCAPSFGFIGRHFPAGDDRFDARIADSTVWLDYFCSACKNDSIAFLIRFIHDKEHGNDGFVMKVGQYPPPSIEVSSELRKSLGDCEHVYKQGRISEVHGFGIGAFAYYRRIVEKLIDSLLDSIGALLADTPEEQPYRVRWTPKSGPRV
jgi:hypothetical protein